MPERGFRPSLSGVIYFPFLSFSAQEYLNTDIHVMQKNYENLLVELEIDPGND